MFARVNNVTGAKDIDAGVAYLRDKVVPELQGQKGFRGLTMSGTVRRERSGYWDFGRRSRTSRRATARSRSCAKRP
jgi:hypothetical protein